MPPRTTTLPARSSTGPRKGSPGRGPNKRRSTENSLLEAFGRIVQRSGLRSIGVNEVLKEAGVGKAALYRYFGGLPGLVEAWGHRNRIWPPAAQLAPLASGDESVTTLQRIVRSNAEEHRANPVRIEMLADELMAPTAISGALAGIRRRVGQEHAKAFADNRLFHAHRDLMIVVMAAASFLAMRAVRAPRFMGADLAEERTWQRLMKRIDRIIEHAVAADDVPASHNRRRKK